MGVYFPVDSGQLAQRFVVGLM